MRRVVVRIQFQAAVEGDGRVAHVAAMVEGYAEVVKSQDELRRRDRRAAIAIDRLVHQAIVEIEGPEQVVGERMIRVAVEEPFQLLARLGGASVLLCRKSQ